MSKRSVFTTITALPPNVTRDVVLDFFHNHEEMIDLNPLVKERHPIRAPADADADEAARCTWYSLTDAITYLPGGLASGDVSYTCAFHDLPDGLQTHCRAPLGVDIRDRWSLNGSLPGEPAEPVELGLDAPAAGLYIREDVDLRCNVFMAGFVKKTLKKSHAALVAHLAAKAQRASAAAVRDSQSYYRGQPDYYSRQQHHHQHQHHQHQHHQHQHHQHQVGGFEPQSHYSPHGYRHSRVPSHPAAAAAAAAAPPYYPFQPVAAHPAGQLVTNGDTYSPYPDPLRLLSRAPTTATQASKYDDTHAVAVQRPVSSLSSSSSNSSSVRSRPASSAAAHAHSPFHPDYPVMNPYADSDAVSPVAKPEQPPARKEADRPVFAELAGNGLAPGHEHPLALKPGVMSATLSGPFLAEFA